ncbi:MAG: phosphatidate cytidylyltransferase [Cytophagaceae bacterium]|nr:phosphatidate cytidylyltransferase [Cytophagaceae bacterium]MDW8456614.1 phosphatidate cytidylyltransferase [Cytophagaceae bacterium]
MPTSYSSLLSKMSNLQQRIVAGTIGGTLMLSGIFINQWTYAGLFLLIAIFCLLEYTNLLISSGYRLWKWYIIVGGAFIYATVFFVQAQYWPAKAYALLLPLCFILPILELFTAGANPLVAMSLSIFAWFYIALPFSLVHFIAIDNNGLYQTENILLVLLLVWANDIGGYFGGRYFGKHKLYEKISPKKTWEGSLSGALFTVCVAGILQYTTLKYTWSHVFITATIIVIAGSLGDLIESQYKRSLQIKDSGQSIPGHGGFLDRFDGFMYSIPFLVFYHYFFVI